jgi:peptide/nickel transport system substrate-binding protein
MQNRSVRRLVGTGLIAGALVSGVFAGAVSAGAAVNPRAGTTLTEPLPTGSTVTSVLPFYSGAQCTTTNIDYWDLQVRPGLWFGLGASITYQPQMSPLAPGAVSYVGANTVTSVTSKGWKFSDGAGHTDTITASNIMFWINMDRAQRNQGSNGEACGFVPGFGLPDQLLNAVPSGNKVTLTFKGHLNKTWTLYNQLSQIVPLAAAWDRTAGGAANCAGQAYASVTEGGSNICTAVFNYLSGLQINNALWAWSDGPYRQQSAGYSGGSPDGNNVQIANTSYSGPGSTAAHAVKRIVYKPYALESSEIAALQSGILSQGTVDPADVTASPGPGKAGHNLLPHLTNYTTLGAVTYGVFYWMFNFGNSHSTYPASSHTSWVALNNQSYFRQAMQTSVDQPAIIKHVENGYGLDTYSALPTYPKNSNNKGVKNPYVYSATRGKGIMKAHGWNVTHFPATCGLHTAVGCGTSAYPIPFGTQAKESVLIPNGDTPVITQATDESNEIKASGIDLVVNSSLDATHVQLACFAGQAAWEMCGYGGWIFSPDYYPSGEVLFVLGSSSNSGGYPSPEMQGLMADNTTSGNVPLNGIDPKYHTSYAQFSATDVPFLWQPTPAGFIEQLKSLHGMPAPSPLTNFNPEYVTSI